MARVAPTAKESKAPVGSLLLLVDTSASRAPGFAKQVAMVGGVMDELRRAHGDAFRLQVACFDQGVASIYSGAAAGFGAAQLAKLGARKALGASDLYGALRWAKGQAGYRRVVLFTDGVITAGKSGEPLRQAVRELGPAVERLDVVLVGGIRDEDAMRALVSERLAQTGVVLDGDRPPAAIAARLGLTALSGVPVAVAGAQWVWPARLQSFQPGDEVVVYADLGQGADVDSQQVQVSFGAPLGYTETLAVQPVSRPLIERAWVRARIARLLAQREEVGDKDPAKAAALKQEVIELSTRYRVLSEYTAMLVLETDADYQRFQLDRRALADILVVGERGVEVLHRAAPPEQQQQQQQQQQMPQPPPVPTAPTLAAPSAAAPARAAAEAPPSAEGGQAAPVAEEAKPDPAASSAGAPAAAPAANARSGPSEKLKELDMPLSASSSKAEKKGAAEPPEKPSKADSADYQPAEPAAPRRAMLRMPMPARSPAAAPVIADDGDSAMDRAERRERSRRGASQPIRSVQVDVDVLRASGSLDSEVIERVLGRHLGELRACAQRAIRQSGEPDGDVEVDFSIGPRGAVTASELRDASSADSQSQRCFARAVKGWAFPAPRSGIVEVEVSFSYEAELAGSREDEFGGYSGCEDLSRGELAAPLSGKLAELHDLLQSGHPAAALKLASDWRDSAPGDVLALLALGEVYEALGQRGEAARAFGSIIDLYPSRADLRRYAGVRLQRLGGEALPLAIDTFQHAVEQRPDHPNSHRLYAFALVRAGQYEAAFAALLAGLQRSYPAGRFAGYDRILRDDLGLIAAVWLKVAPVRRKEVEERLSSAGAALSRSPTLRFVLSWETDGNDVDFHILDQHHSHACYASPTLRSGGELYADVTTGYGPECFTIPGPPRAFPYHLEAHYYSRGPMGYGLGQVEVIQHDGNGGLKFEQRMFVIMNDHAYVDLGTLKGPL